MSAPEAASSQTRADLEQVATDANEPTKVEANEKVQEQEQARERARAREMDDFSSAIDGAISLSDTGVHTTSPADSGQNSGRDDGRDEGEDEGQDEGQDDDLLDFSAAIESAIGGNQREASSASPVVSESDAVQPKFTRPMGEAGPTNEQGRVGPQGGDATRKLIASKLAEDIFESLNESGRKSHGRGGRGRGARGGGGGGGVNQADLRRIFRDKIGPLGHTLGKGVIQHIMDSLPDRNARKSMKRIVKASRIEYADSDDENFDASVVTERLAPKATRLAAQMEAAKASSDGAAEASDPVAGGETSSSLTRQQRKNRRSRLKHREKERRKRQAATGELPPDQAPKEAPNEAPNEDKETNEACEAKPA